jgi:SAM-dependent methyltransferase
MPEPAWYESFFSGLWLDVQRAIKTPEMTERDAGIVERALALAPGARVLDAPCGEGRIALELAARGYSVTGVDRTPALLEDARAAAADRGLEISLLQADLRDLPYESEFDAAFCFWSSFGYFDDVGNVEHARMMARALKPGGRFLIDTHVVDALLTRLDPGGITPVGDIELRERCRWDHEAGRLESEWTLVRGDASQTIHSSIRIYTYRELVHVLLAAGFERVEGLASPDLGPFDIGAARLCAVATTPG